MSDDLGLFADDAGERPRRNRKQKREDREQFRRRRRRRTMTALAGLGVLLVVGGGVLYGAGQFFQIGTYDDYEGAGSGQVVIEVESGESTSSIASTLVDKDVTASTKAFTAAAEDNNQISGIQPGFYLMKKRMSGSAAVEQIVSPEAKAGQLEVRGGMRLEDQLRPDGGRTPGILTMLAEASCTGSNGQCATSEQLHEASANSDLASLGAPQWAIEPTAKAEPKRRLEGLIMPGIYNVKPGEKPEELLRQVVTESAAKLEAAGLPQAAEGTGHTPYEVLTVASLAQSEGLEKDFRKVTRVVYNRLARPMPLQMDSTINYPLDKPTLMTKSEDREKPGPYNTYKYPELPITPISSMSKQAIEAAENPEDGEWIYFVKCQKDGTSCFAKNDAEHQQYKREAQERGAY